MLQSVFIHTPTDQHSLHSTRRVHDCYWYSEVNKYDRAFLRVIFAKSEKLLRRGVQWRAYLLRRVVLPIWFGFRAFRRLVPAGSFLGLLRQRVAPPTIFCVTP